MRRIKTIWKILDTSIGRNLAIVAVLTVLWSVYSFFGGMRHDFTSAREDLVAIKADINDQGQSVDALLANSGIEKSKDKATSTSP